MAETLTVPTYEQIATILSKLATNYSNLASVFYEVFYYDTPADVTFNLYDKDGVLQEYTIPNRAKDLQNLLSGNESPEGNVEAPIGALYQDLTNGDLYIKETPDGAEGWNLITTTNYLRNIFIQGNGTPEGNVEASKGILYIDASSASLYIKTTITGNTGWEMISATVGAFADVDLSNLSPRGENRIANRDLSNLTPLGGDRFANKSLSNLNGVGEARFSGKEDVSNKVTTLSSSSSNIQYPSAKCVYDRLQAKQDKLVSGTNIKTIDNNSILGSGNLDINVDGKILNILKQIYPVGAIYIGTTSTCPMAALFGTWTLVAEDRCLQGSGSHSANSNVAAGLPNIVGEAQNVHEGPSPIGAFTAKRQSVPAWNQSSAGYVLGFNASNYNSIYGSNNTVQPPAYVVNVWRRVA